MANKSLEVAVELSEDPERYEDAEKAFIQSLKQDPENKEACFLFLSFEIQQNWRHVKDRVTAKTEAGKALEELIVRCFQELLTAAKKSKVEDDQTIGLGVEDLSFIYELRGVYEKRLKEDYEHARAAFETSCKIDQENDSAKYNLATLLDQVFNEQEKAIQLYREVLLKSPEHVLAMNNLAALYVQKAKETVDNHQQMVLYRQASEHFERAETIEPGLPAFNLACIRCLQNDLDAGKEWLAKALQSNAIDLSDSIVVEQLLSDDDLEKLTGTQEGKEWLHSLLLSCGVTPEQLQQCIGQEDSIEVAMDLSASSSDNAQPPCNGAQHDVEVAVHSDFCFPFAKRFVYIDQIDSSLSNTQDLADKPVGTTGWTVWNSSLVLLRMLEDGMLSTKKSPNTSPDLQGKRVLDLSGGLGVLGICCAKLSAKVTITDIGTTQLAGVRKNVEMNSLSVSDESGVSSVAVKELVWGQEGDLQGIDAPFDIVLASDLLYIAIRDSLQKELVQTLLSLVKKGSLLVLMYEVRQPLEEDTLLQLLQVSDKEVKIEEREIPYNSAELKTLLEINQYSRDLVKHTLALNLDDMFIDIPQFKIFHLTRS